MSDLLRRIEEAERGATPGPWEVRDSTERSPCMIIRKRIFDPPVDGLVGKIARETAFLCDLLSAKEPNGSNAALIVLLRNSVPEIVAALEERPHLVRVAEAAARVSSGNTLPGPEGADLRDALRAIKTAGRG